MRILVTGAAGFIGSHVTRELLAAGHEVTALVRPHGSRPLERIADVVDRVAVIEADLANRATYSPVLRAQPPEACVHLAWYAKPGAYLHAAENVPALTASLELLAALYDVGCSHVTIAGTCAEYDQRAGFSREDSPTAPETIYAAAKLSLCLMAQQLAARQGTTVAWGRVFSPYGPAEDPNRAVPALIRALLEGRPFPATAGAQIRDYVHVEDVAAAFCVLVERCGSGIYNISSGEPVTMRRLMETIGRIVGRPELIEFGAVPYRDWEPEFIGGSNRKLRGLGWTPRYDLETGLRNTVDWWRDNRDPA